MTAGRTLTMVVADDHAIVRSGLQLAASRPGWLKVVAEAEDGVAALAEVRRHRPDLLLADIAMPRTTGVELLEEVRRWAPETRVFLLTGLTSRNLLLLARDSGAAGLALKTEDPDDWIPLLRAAAAGRQMISPAVRVLLDEAAGEHLLSARERQILLGVARGETNQMMAERLGISASTVDKHRTSLMRKLGVHSVAELLARALRDGLLDPARHL